MFENLKYQNYHRHSSYSNIMTPDSGAMNVDYAKRAVELGHGIISSCEHGFQGNYWETYSLAEKYNLKFIFGAEAYWVKNKGGELVDDELKQDNTNNHICIFAKNDSGRKAINLLLSDANEFGFYYKPRASVDDILSLPKDDVFITSACIGFWGYGYEYSEEFVKKLSDRFGDNFMLEVQYHNTDKQKQLNKNILELSKKYKIKTIMGCDSHFIKDEQKYDRDYILEYKGVKYPDEVGWYMDYPDTDVAVLRFQVQGVLSDDEIFNSINNTNVFLDFDDIVLSKDKKLPSLFPELSQAEKDKMYLNIIKEELDKYIKDNNLTADEVEKYKKGIMSEVKSVIETGMSDYFILDHYIVKEGVNNGGIITTSGRGSAVSFFTNTLLGFSSVDRFKAPVHMYPERFLSATRIIQSGSLPDIDLNLGNVEVFAEAQKKLLGDEHSAPMIAYGTLKAKSAWKMYAGANPDSIDFETAQEISNAIGKYEEDYKYAEDDEKDTVDVLDYIPEQYVALYNESIKYQGIIMDKKSHASAYLIYDKNIREEIGLMKCKSESSKKEYLVALIDGKSADNFGYLKNDLLKVNVCLLHHLTAQRAGISPISVNEVLEISKQEDKIWKIYENGFTLGVNQCEKKSTTKKVMEYKPKNDGDLTCFIAAIRPSFKSMYSHFSKRIPFNYGIKTFDDIVQTETLKDSFLFFQEQIMSALSFSGIPMDECYDIIKAISKKKVDLIKSYKEQFSVGFKQKIIEAENCTEEVADESVNKIWQIIEDASAYGFNASHAYCMCCDSMMDAYYKAYYPYEFYEVRLNYYSETGKKDKVAKYKQEMFEAFGIKEGTFKFGNDNRRFTIDKDNECIHPSITSIKGLGIKDGEALYQARNNHYSTFLDLYEDIKPHINTGKVSTLIKLDYFSEFGKSDYLLKQVEIYNQFYDKSTVKKENLTKLGLPHELVVANCEKETAKQYSSVNMRAIINYLVDKLPNIDIEPNDRIKHELEVLGYIQYINPNIYNQMYLSEVKLNKYGTPFFTMYNINNGKTATLKVNKKYFIDNSVETGDIIAIVNIENKPQRRKDENGAWQVVGTEKVLESYRKL